MYKTSTREQILAVCVGDTIDFPRHSSAWPKNRAELEGHPKGKAMFKIARASLARVAEAVPSYKAVMQDLDKFCHGFGMFQYDIQFFKTDSDYFLNRGWETFSGTLGKGINELKTQMNGLFGPGKTSLTHDESVFLAIAYNQGWKRTKASLATKGFEQGFKDSDGLFYGEHIDRNLTAIKGLF